MEIISLFVALAFLGYLTQRQERARIFPQQPCIECALDIYFDWRQQVWLHEDGVQYKPCRGVTSVLHPALPSNLS